MGEGKVSCCKVLNAVHEVVQHYLKMTTQKCDKLKINTKDDKLKMNILWMSLEKKLEKKEV